MKEIFQFFPNDVTNTKPLGFITLETFLNKVRKPNPETIDLYQAIEKASKDKDEAKRSELKSKLYYFTPAVHLNNGRGYKNIAKWTGLLVLDFDKIHFADEFRDYIFNEYNFIYAAWLSSSKYGVRAFAKIPQVFSTDEYKALFYGVKDLLGVYNGFDMAPQNCVLPLYLSYDEDVRIRTEPDTWTTTGVNEKDFKYSIPQDYKPVQSTEKDVATIEKIVISGISKINDNGHPQLRGVAVSLGGYVGAGYLDEATANQIITGVINSNAYLSKKPKVYIKTAFEMIQYGQTKPLYL